MSSQQLAPIASAESFVRDSLRQLEAALREAALLALVSWQRTEIVAPALFRELAALHRPSFGRWNGLLAALRGRGTRRRAGAKRNCRRPIGRRFLDRLCLEWNWTAGGTPARPARGCSGGGFRARRPHRPPASAPSTLRMQASSDGNAIGRVLRENYSSLILQRV